MWYVIVAIVCLVGGGYLSYRYGRSVENKVWKGFMAVRGFSEREFEKMKQAYDKGIAIVRHDAQAVQQGAAIMGQKVGKKL
jgi:hypothetical protein